MGSLRFGFLSNVAAKWPDCMLEKSIKQYFKLPVSSVGAISVDWLSQSVEVEFLELERVSVAVFRNI